MSRDPRHDILFEPVRIGPKVLKNRFYSVPHCTGFGVYEPNTLAAFRGTKAEGGWAAVCSEACEITPHADGMPDRGDRIYDDQDAKIMAGTAAAVHAHGALAGIELAHSGLQAGNRLSRYTTMGPSQGVSDYRDGVNGKAMERHEIEESVQQWVTAARRARDAGFDIIYVYGGHSYLLTQFLSSRFNRRTDDYGGSLRNRARLWLETLAAVRDEVGDDCAIAVRVAADALGPSDESNAEMVEFIGMADELTDLWDFCLGPLKHWWRDAPTSRLGAEGHQLEWTDRIRAAATKPVVGVGRYSSPDMMAEVVRSGRLDLIGAARPTLADPFLPKKIEAGRYEDLKECTGTNFCVMRQYHDHIACVQNPTLGEEYRRGWHPEHVPALTGAAAQESVLVVGAGPAGLECAVTLAKRGAARVHLVDAADDPGGHLRWVGELPGLSEWRRIVAYRKIQLDKHQNVEFIGGTRLDADAILDYGADVVVLATGARWVADGSASIDFPPVPGIDEARTQVFTPDELLCEGRQLADGPVLIYDTENFFMGSALAEKLCKAGYSVTIATPNDVVSALLDVTTEGPEIRQRLRDIGVRLMTGTVLDRVAPGEAFVRVYRTPETLPFANLVLTTKREADEDLYVALRDRQDELDAAGIRALVRAGDCVAPRFLGDAVFDGHRVARAIENRRPDAATDYRREMPPSVGAPTLPEALFLEGV